MIDILSQLQADLLDRNASLSDTLRKAKVLASQLGSEELDTWVSQELDGYKDKNSLPDYRVLHTSVAGTWTNGYFVQQFRGVPLYAIKDKDLIKGLTTYYVTSGISLIANLANLPDGQKLSVAADVLAYVNSLIGEDGYGYTQLSYAVGAHNFKQILDTVKTRLLDFVLKLGKEWTPKGNPPGHNEIDRLISITIYNSSQVGAMTLFDQRGQQVQYQFNAAGNINIELVQSAAQLVTEISKLREEIDRAKQLGVVSGDIATEAQYHLLEASREATKKQPKKSTMLEKINKTKELVKEVSSLAGLIVSLTKLAEVIEKLFN